MPHLCKGPGSEALLQLQQAHVCWGAQDIRVLLGIVQSDFLGVHALWSRACFRELGARFAVTGSYGYLWPRLDNLVEDVVDAAPARVPPPEGPVQHTAAGEDNRKPRHHRNSDVQGGHAARLVVHLCSIARITRSHFDGAHRDVAFGPLATGDAANGRHRPSGVPAAAPLEMPKKAGECEVPKLADRPILGLRDVPTVPCAIVLLGLAVCPGGILQACAQRDAAEFPLPREAWERCPEVELPLPWPYKAPSAWVVEAIPAGVPLHSAEVKAWEVHVVPIHARGAACRHSGVACVVTAAGARGSGGLAGVLDGGERGSLDDRNTGCVVEQQRCVAHAEGHAGEDDLVEVQEPPAVVAIDRVHLYRLGEIALVGLHVLQDLQGVDTLPVGAVGRDGRVHETVDDGEGGAAAVRARVAAGEAAAIQLGPQERHRHVPVVMVQLKHPAAEAQAVQHQLPAFQRQPLGIPGQGGAEGQPPASLLRPPKSNVPLDRYHILPEVRVV
mmetsp:Transcript_26070/g.72997  ORF Transcript_26070/g.72997 Transcript_26070/m.72997 type:complete len:500 (+) Transcript_26070:1276-2775(+)